MKKHTETVLSSTWRSASPPGNSCASWCRIWVRIYLGSPTESFRGSFPIKISWGSLRTYQFFPYLLLPYPFQSPLSVVFPDNATWSRWRPSWPRNPKDLWLTYLLLLGSSPRSMPPSPRTFHFHLHFCFDVVQNHSFLSHLLCLRGHLMLLHNPLNLPGPSHSGGTKSLLLKKLNHIQEQIGVLDVVSIN